MKVKFTKLAALLLAGVALLAAGCTDYEVDIQKVDKKVDELAQKTAADLNAQVDALKAMIATLETNYKAADEALKAQIQQQIDKINGQISDLQSTKLDKTTFDAYKAETAETLRLLNEAVDMIKENYATKEELNTAVAGIYEKLDDYVLKTTFEEFVKIAATKAELEAAKKDLQDELAKAKSELEQAIKDGDEALEKKMDEKIGKINEAIEKLEGDLEELAIRVTSLEGTVNDIVDELAFAEGDLQAYIDDADAATLEAAKAYTDELIDDLIEQLNEILDQIYSRLAMALQRIQSIVYVPDYDDLKITSNMAFVTQTVTPEAEGEDAAPAEPEKVVLAIDEPTQVTYQFLPAQYAGTIARAIKETLENPITREDAKDTGYEGIVAWFSVKPVNTRADEAEVAAPEFNIVSVDKYDEASGEITFTVMPKNVASAAFAANGIKPNYSLEIFTQDGSYIAGGSAATMYGDQMYFGGDRLPLSYDMNDWVLGVYSYEDLKAFEARSAFAAQLRLYHLQDYDLDIDWDTFEYDWIDYENELASAYNVLYPGVTEIEILPDPYKPEEDEDGNPKKDEDGNTVLVSAVPDYQYLPYSALRKDGEDAVGEKPEQDPKGYRVVMDQAVPGLLIDGKVYTVEDAAKMGHLVPTVTTNFKEFTFDQNTAEAPLDEENFIVTPKVYAEVEMNPEKSAAERKLAVGNVITGHYFFETVLGKTPFEGDVEITKPLGSVDATAEILWTYAEDADVDHNLFYPDEQVEGGTVYQRLVYEIALDEEDVTFLKNKLDVSITDFAGLQPKNPTVAIADIPEEGAEPEFAEPIALSECDLTIENVAIKDGKLYADFVFPQEAWNKIYKIVAPYETETALITVNGVVTTIDRNREKVVLGPYEHTFIVNGEEFVDGYYHWTSEKLNGDVFEAFDADGVINVKGITLENGDFKYAADQKKFDAAELEGKLRMADPSGTAKGYVDFNRNDIVLNTLSTLTPEVLAGELFNSGKRSETDPNLWLGNEVTRNVTTYIGEEVELVMVFNFKVPDYNFLHLSYYTFNTNEEVTEDNFIQKYALPAEIEGVPTPYDAPIWWTQVNPSYFTTVKEKGTPEAEAQTRVSNRYALADYDVAYINLSELAFNVVDDKDDIIEAEDLEKLGLVAKFVYTDKALEADDAELPKPDKDACDNEFLLYKSLWVDNTTFYYLTNEHPFIPALGTLTLNVGEEGKGGYAFPVATRFEFPKEAVKHAGVNLDYSSYAMVRWTPFKAPKANGFTIVLDENKVYAEPLFKGMELKDNRPNNTSFFVIQDGEWVVGNAAENATKSSTTNGYMKGINAKEAYHIKAAFDYSDVELPAELKKLLKVKFSADGKTFVDENDENETLTPYVVFDYTSEVQFRGTITIPVVVRLQNPWQQEIKFAYNFIIKGVE